MHKRCQQQRHLLFMYTCVLLLILASRGLVSCGRSFNEHCFKMPKLADITNYKDIYLHQFWTIIDNQLCRCETINIPTTLKQTILVRVPNLLFVQLLKKGCPNNGWGIEILSMTRTDLNIPLVSSSTIHWYCYCGVVLPYVKMFKTLMYSVYIYYYVC